MALPSHEAVTGLSEHIEPILFTLCFAIATLIALLGWFGKRTIGKLEQNVEDLWELCRETIQRDVNALDKRLTTLETEHRVRHKGDKHDAS